MAEVQWSADPGPLDFFALAFDQPGHLQRWSYPDGAEPPPPGGLSARALQLDPRAWDFYGADDRVGPPGRIDGH